LSIGWTLPSGGGAGWKTSVAASSFVPSSTLVLRAPAAGRVGYKKIASTLRCVSCEEGGAGVQCKGRDRRDAQT
jgi:hypothetical protein